MDSNASFVRTADSPHTTSGQRIPQYTQFPQQVPVNQQPQFVNQPVTQNSPPPTSFPAAPLFQSHSASPPRQIEQLTYPTSSSLFLQHPSPKLHQSSNSIPQHSILSPLAGQRDDIQLNQTPLPLSEQNQDLSKPISTSPLDLLPTNAPTNTTDNNVTLNTPSPRRMEQQATVPYSSFDLNSVMGQEAKSFDLPINIPPSSAEKSLDLNPSSVAPVVTPNLPVLGGNALSTLTSSGSQRSPPEEDGEILLASLHTTNTEPGAANNFVEPLPQTVDMNLDTIPTGMEDVSLTTPLPISLLPATVIATTTTTTPLPLEPEVKSPTTQVHSTLPIETEHDTTQISRPLPSENIEPLLHCVDVPAISLSTTPLSKSTPPQIHSPPSPLSAHAAHSLTVPSPKLTVPSNTLPSSTTPSVVSTATQMTSLLSPAQMPTPQITPSPPVPPQLPSINSALGTHAHSPSNHISHIVQVVSQNTPPTPIPTSTTPMMIPQLPSGFPPQISPTLLNNTWSNNNDLQSNGAITSDLKSVQNHSTTPAPQAAQIASLDQSNEMKDSDGNSEDEQEPLSLLPATALTPTPAPVSKSTSQNIPPIINPPLPVQTTVPRVLTTISDSSSTTLLNHDSYQHIPSLTQLNNAALLNSPHLIPASTLLSTPQHSPALGAVAVSQPVPSMQALPTPSSSLQQYPPRQLLNCLPSSGPDLAMSSANTLAMGTPTLPPLSGVHSAVSPHMGPSTPTSGVMQGSPLLGSQPAPSCGVRVGNMRYESALDFLDQVKQQFSDNPVVYNQFLDVMKEFKNQNIDTPGVITKVKELFQGHPSLVSIFNTFLPSGFRIEDTEIQQRKAPEINEARNYVKKIKNRFAGQPNIYKEFLQILHKYHEEHLTIKDVYEQVASLFHEHQDLLDDFSMFLPEQVQPEQLVSAPQRKIPPRARKQKRSHEEKAQSGRRPKRPAKRDDSRRPFESKEDISEMAPEGAMDAMAPVEDSAVLSRIKEALPPLLYNEFLKCLSLFAQEVLTKGELVSLTKDILASNPALLDSFKQFIDYNEQQPSGIPHSPAIGVNAPGMNSVPPSPPLPAQHRQHPHQPAQQGAQQTVPNQHALPHHHQHMLMMQQQQTMLHPPVTIHPSHNPQASLPITQASPQLTPQPLPPASQQQNAHHAHQTSHSVHQHASHPTVAPSPVSSPHLTAAPSPSPSPAVSHGPSNGVGLQSPEERKSHSKELHPPQTTVRWGSDSPRSGPSYLASPSSAKCSGRTALDESVLNDKWRSQPKGSEEVARHNQHKHPGESVSRIEDELLEHDLNVAQTQSAIKVLMDISRKLSELSTEAAASHKLDPDAISGLGKKAILRLYGEHGGAIMQFLTSDPHIAVPVVLSRLKQKDQEWYRAKSEYSKYLRTVGNKIQTKSLSQSTNSFKVAERKAISPKFLLSEILNGETSATSDKVGKPPSTTGNVQPNNIGFLKYTMPLTSIHTDIAKLILSVPEQSIEEVEREKMSLFMSKFLSPLIGVNPENLDLPCSSPQFFYGNTSFYLFFRLYQILYDRLALALNLSSNQYQAPSSCLLTPSHYHLPRHNITPAEKYDYCIESIFSIRERSLDPSIFEDDCRSYFGPSCHLLFTLPNLVTRLITTLRSLLANDTCCKLLSLFSANQQAGALQHGPLYYVSCADLLGSDPCFSFCFTWGNNAPLELVIRLVDLTSQPLFVPVSEVSFDRDACLHQVTKLPTCSRDDCFAQKHKLFLLRNRHKSEKDPSLGNLDVLPGLQARVHVVSGNMLFVENTEDSLFRKRPKVPTASNNNNNTASSPGLAVPPKKARGESLRALFHRAPPPPTTANTSSSHSVL
ncbi:Paired amphipathic helix protein Sin3b [Pelomyxa schiedti]|nr:Paired amphipathic helix protein Sin3b [Pelomyxa schiedti]